MEDQHQSLNGSGFGEMGFTNAQGFDDQPVNQGSKDNLGFVPATVNLNPTNQDDDLDEEEKERVRQIEEEQD